MSRCFILPSFFNRLHCHLQRLVPALVTATRYGTVPTLFEQEERKLVYTILETGYLNKVTEGFSKPSNFWSKKPVAGPRVRYAFGLKVVRHQKLPHGLALAWSLWNALMWWPGVVLNQQGLVWGGRFWASLVI